MLFRSARIAAVGVENVPGTAAMIFNELDKNEIPVDMIVQSVRRINDRRGDIIFTVASSDLVEAKEVLEKLKADGRINNILYDDILRKTQDRRYFNARDYTRGCTAGFAEIG